MLENKCMSLEEAVSLVKDGDTIWINAFSAIASPVDLNRALTRRFRETGHPRGLKVYSAFSFSDWKKDSDVEGYICEGAVDMLVAGFFGSLERTCGAIQRNEIEAYNIPGGVMSHMIRAAARGSRSLWSKIGVNLFVDPRVGSCGLNERSTKQLVRVAVDLDGQEGLVYDIPQVDIAFLKATEADLRGNISFRRDCASIDALSVAQATHRNGGKVIVQVLKTTHYLTPSEVTIPAALVDAIVVCPEQQQLTNIDGYYDYISGNYIPRGRILRACKDEIQEKVGATHARNDLHYVIARRAFREIQPEQIINIGIGIPELIAEEVLSHDMLDTVHLSVESGHTGGYPLGGKGFGAAISPDTMLDMARQFDFYEGGGLDLCFIGALEVDAEGNVNGHHTAGKLSGIGGFANISQATKNVVFCFTFDAKGLAGHFDGEQVHIDREGTVPKLVEHVGGISFSAKNGLKNGQNVLYITERCVFRLTEGGLELCEVAPGIDLQRDILDRLPFAVRVAEDLRPMAID